MITFSLTLKKLPSAQFPGMHKERKTSHCLPLDPSESTRRRRLAARHAAIALFVRGRSEKKIAVPLAHYRSLLYNLARNSDPYLHEYGKRSANTFTSRGKNGRLPAPRYSSCTKQTYLLWRHLSKSKKRLAAKR